MSIRRKNREQQSEMWIANTEVAQSPGHPFYRRLNQVLQKHGFDGFVESLCEEYYGSRGRPSIEPGNYFRMLFIGYFEGIGSERGIEWRCADSLSLREFLGLNLSDRVPDHSSLSRIRQRLPLPVHMEVFSWVEAAPVHRLNIASAIRSTTSCAPPLLQRPGSSQPIAHRGAQALCQLAGVVARTHTLQLGLVSMNIPFLPSPATQYYTQSVLSIPLHFRPASC